MLKGKKILIGVTSGIAIYKVLTLISNLRKRGAEVQVIMTESAVKFINPITFETMSNNPVYTHMWQHSDQVLHVDITNDVDLFLIAPSTANTIAKVYGGIADNLVTTAILASKAPVVFAVTTNTNMLLNPVTQRNISYLQTIGYDFIESNEGQLACNTIGKGRMAEPEEILDYIEFKITKKDLTGKNILVTSGPTISRLDPVRYMTNDSSGKMGFALAKAARNRGANTTLIHGKVTTPKLALANNISVNTNQEMIDAIELSFDGIHALIMAAAPVDYEFEVQHDKKLKKDTDDLTFSMEKSQDILKYFGQKKKDQVLVGFAAETNDLVENARKKLVNKNLDLIVANDVTQDGAGFNTDTNIATIIGKDFEKSLALMSKDELANIILDEMVENAL